MSRLIGSIALFFILVAGPCSAQSSHWSDEDNRWAHATWVDDLNFLSMNALLGGLTAGIVSHLCDGSFRDGFVTGALGGGVTYVGKRIAAARFLGAGFLGREVVAVGGSMVRNASLGVGVLDTLVLPIGPLRVFATPLALRGTRLRLNLFETAGLIYGLSKDSLDLDWGRTLSAGISTFLTDAEVQAGGETANGMTAGGIIILSRQNDGDLDGTFAHERVHVLQIDFFETAVGFSAEQWVGRKLGLERIPFYDQMVMGVGFNIVHYPLSGPWSRPNDFLEVEAGFLGVR